MNFLTEKIEPMYFKYLFAAFGSALITSVYGIVDMAMVGQYQGPEGTAATAVIAPVWNIIYSLGLLMGDWRLRPVWHLAGQSEKNAKRSNEYFTAFSNDISSDFVAKYRTLFNLYSFHIVLLKNSKIHQSFSHYRFRIT